MALPKLLGISGSLRDASANSKLVHEAARLFGEADFTMADIRFPVFDADDQSENGIPAAVQLVADQIAAADAVVLSTPEYNKGPSGVLKNALDWVSRTDGTPWRDKPLAVMSAAAGRAGGERAQMILRGFMVPFRPRILQGPEMHLANCNEQFDDEGRLTGDLYVKTLQELMYNLRAELD